MKSCSGKPCDGQGDCEYCGMADGSEVCPECGTEKEPVTIRARKRKDWRMMCPNCGHESKLGGEKL